MIERLKELRKNLGLNQTALAEYFGITQTAYSMIETGVHPLSTKYIKMLCAIFHVSEKWLVDGEGEMFESIGKEEQELLDIFKLLYPETKNFLLLMSKQLLDTQEKLLCPK